MRYGVYVGVSDDNEDHARALADLLQVEECGIASVRPVEIDETTFHGDWYDARRRKLVWNGRAGGRDRPDLVKLDASGPRSATGPGLWEPGGHAFAFVNPPYGLRANGRQIQEAYDDVCRRILPQGRHRILNWHCRALLAAAPDLDCGTEWWGVYAFTIYAEPPAHAGQPPQIAAVVAATTD